MSAIEIKEYRKRHNLTQRQLAEITKCSLRAVQYWESQGRKVPESARELMKIYEKNNQSHNEATYNTQKNNNSNNGDNSIYINSTGAGTTTTITQDKDTTGQCNEIKEMTKLLNQLHETKIIEIDRLTKLYNGIISNQNEFIDTLKDQVYQYRKEIESLKQRIKGNTENNKE